VKPIVANTSGRAPARARSVPLPPSLEPAAAAAIRTLKDEHLAIASVLFGLRLTVRRLAESGTAEDTALIGAMLDYVVAFPERLHHPKESRYLFKALAARCPRARALIDELEAEHVRGAALIESLQARLDAYRRERATRDALTRAVDDYADFHWRHMAKEEETLLPLAQRHLTAADWERIDAAFRANDNPLAGISPKTQVQSLYHRILSLTPTASGMRPGGARRSRT